jgi:Tfp pilus assembly protein PilO
MTSYLDKLNLRPSEKRLVVIIGVVVFVVLNVWFVIPRFSDWSRVERRMVLARQKLKMFQTEADQIKNYQTQVRNLESEASSMPREEQSAQFQRAIEMQSAESGVNLQTTSKLTSQTNLFFLELTQMVGVQSAESQLVDFLYNLGAGNSLIRVRELTLRPDQPRQQLMASVKLVASYQKSTPVRSTVDASAASRAAAKPAPERPRPTPAPPQPKAAPTTTTTAPQPKPNPAPAIAPTKSSSTAPVGINPALIAKPPGTPGGASPSRFPIEKQRSAPPSAPAPGNPSTPNR